MTASKRGPAFPLPCTPESVVRCALAAYYRAVGDCTAPRGDPDPAGWSDPAFFLETLTDFFQLKLHMEAAAAGHPVQCESERWERWMARPLPQHRTLCRELGPNEGCQCGNCIPASDAPGRESGNMGTPELGNGSPDVEGHGCPDLVSPLRGLPA